MIDSIPGMDEYIQSLLDNRLDDAKYYLIVAITAIKHDCAAAACSGIAQQFGEICLAQGDKHSAIFLHELSEILDQGSLLAKLDYAKFLYNKMHDKKRASAKCDEIIHQAQKYPFQKTDDDFSS
jgi:hypothetical protein